MSKRVFRDQSELWLSRPLCRRYVAGIFSTALVRVSCVDGAREQSIHWALGCLRDGGWEVLGAWMHLGTDLVLPLAVLADLEKRGVECIRFAVCSDLTGVGDVRETPVGATELPSIERTLAVAVAQVASRHRGAVECERRAVASAGSSDAADEALRAIERGPSGDRYPQIVAQWAPLFQKPAALRRVVLAGDHKAVTLHASLCRSIRRQGCFFNQAEALDFIAGALQRAERRLQLELAFALTRPRLRRAAAPGGQALPGLC